MSDLKRTDEPELRPDGWERFERAGTPAFWLVEPEGPSLTAYQLREGRYELAAEVAAGESWTATVPYEVTLTPHNWAD